jgi:hypothetical protein
VLSQGFADRRCFEITPSDSEKEKVPTPDRVRHHVAESNESNRIYRIQRVLTVGWCTTLRITELVDFIHRLEFEITRKYNFTKTEFFHLQLRVRRHHARSLGNISSFRNTVFFSYLEFRTMNQVQSPMAPTEFGSTFNLTTEAESALEMFHCLCRKREDKTCPIL